MKGMSGLAQSIIAAMVVSGMSVPENNIRAIVDEPDNRPRQKPAKRFKPTPEAEAERIRKAQEKRERKAAKLRAKQ